MGKTDITAEPGSHAIAHTREFEAPRELVFRAYTDPDLIVRWLGGDDLAMTIDSYDVRHGGTWRYVHTEPDGEEFWFRGIFHGAPSLDGIIQTFEYEGRPGIVSLDSVNFEDAGGRTILHSHSVFQSVEARDWMIANGMREGINSGHARLEVLLADLVQT